jgi:ankyrin repeat protein
MADVGDTKALQKQVFKLAREDNLLELTALLEEHPEVDVDGWESTLGWTALCTACHNGHTECAQLLIDHRADVKGRGISGGSALHLAVRNHLSCVELLVQNGADVNSEADGGWTPLICSAFDGRLNSAQYLLEQKADVHYRVSDEGYSKNDDALFYAMRTHATDRIPGIAFAFLCCITDAKNVKIQNQVTTTVRDAHIEAYSHVQAFIDEYHSILTRVLSDHVQVDTRVGRGDNGIYQEPLERTLKYLGLSMGKDQVVNTSIDGEAVKRALIPGHLLNANHWFNKYRAASS